MRKHPPFVAAGRSLKVIQEFNWPMNTAWSLEMRLRWWQLVSEDYKFQATTSWPTDVKPVNKAPYRQIQLADNIVGMNVEYARLPLPDKKVVWWAFESEADLEAFCNYFGGARIDGILS